MLARWVPKQQMFIQRPEVTVWAGLAPSGWRQPLVQAWLLSWRLWRLRAPARTSRDLCSFVVWPLPKFLF